MTGEIVEIVQYVKYRTPNTSLTADELVEEYFDKRVVWSKEKREWQFLMNKAEREAFVTMIVKEAAKDV